MKPLSKPNIILILVPLLLAVQMRFGTAQAFDRFADGLVLDPSTAAYARIFFQYLANFLLLLVIQNYKSLHFLWLITNF